MLGHESLHLLEYPSAKLHTVHGRPMSSPIVETQALTKVIREGGREVRVPAAGV